MSNVPILPAVRAAEAFRRLNWRRAAPVLGLAAVTDALVQCLSMMGVMSGPWMVFNLVAYTAAYGALMRLAFIDEHPGDPEFVPGRGGVQFRRPELRLVGVWLMLGFLIGLAFFTIVFLGLLVAISAGFIAVTAETKPETMWTALGAKGQAAVWLTVFASIAGLTYVLIRLSLATAATIACKQVLMFQTWALTRGQFWRILVATLLVSAPMLLTGGALSVLIRAAAGAGGTVPMAIALIAGALHGAVWGFIALPLGVGLTAFLYRGLRSSAPHASVR